MIQGGLRSGGLGEEKLQHNKKNGITVPQPGFASKCL